MTHTKKRDISDLKTKIINIFIANLISSACECECHYKMNNIMYGSYSCIAYKVALTPPAFILVKDTPQSQ